ncbi:hypothetical protein [Pseudenterobacter timonensis]|uniref:Poly A polymerase head domain-containing protein n=1 Tax=Pseudenterobacter timonensis TaxID=1755099 RepID=A0ABV4A1G8_9ENTR
MNMKVVPSHQRLKLRIENFFDTCDERKQARALIDALAGEMHAWIFGGMVRDMGLFGRKGFISDIDLVVDGSREELLHTLHALNIHQLRVNKLGGVRFRLNGLDFDIWCIQDTWAFRNRHVKFEDASSLFKTTLMSWDAVLYDLKQKRVLSPENYLHDLHQRRLELVLGMTPNQPGAVVKILRTIYNKRVQIVGPQLCHYLRVALQTWPVDALRQYEYGRYHTHSFNEADLRRLKSCLCHARSGYDIPLERQP